MYHTTLTNHFRFDFFDLLTLDDLDWTQGHKRLMMVIRSIPDTIHVVPSTLFQFDTAALPAKPAVTDIQKIVL